MRLKTLKVQYLQIPLRINFKQGNNAAAKSDSIIVTVTTDTGVTGYGESCPRQYVTGETQESVTQDIRNVCSSVLSKNFTGIICIRDLVTKELYGRIGLASICAIELALLDAWGKENKLSLINTFKNQVKPQFYYSGVVPFGNIDQMEPLLRQFHFKDVKLKVGPDIKENLHRLEKIKAIYGNKVALRVDANCSWNLADAEAQIPVLMKAGVQVFEQCFPKSGDQDMARITQLFGKEVCIMADESVCTFKDAQNLIQNKICNGFNLKIAKHGGIFNTLRIIELAKRNNIYCQLGAHYGETSLLTMAGLIVAAATPQIRHLEGGLGTILLKQDLCDSPLQIDHQANISIANYPFSHGLGVGVNPDILKYSIKAGSTNYSELNYYISVN